MRPSRSTASRSARSRIARRDCRRRSRVASAAAARSTGSPVEAPIAARAHQQVERRGALGLAEIEVEVRLLDLARQLGLEVAASTADGRSCRRRTRARCRRRPTAPARPAPACRARSRVVTVSATWSRGAYVFLSGSILTSQARAAVAVDEPLGQRDRGPASNTVTRATPAARCIAASAAARCTTPGASSPRTRWPRVEQLLAQHRGHRDVLRSLQRTPTRSALSWPSKSSRLRSTQPSCSASGSAYVSVMPAGRVISAW